jgi:histidine ammonia-lyase
MAGVTPVVSLGPTRLTLGEYEAVVYGGAGVRIAAPERVAAHRAALVDRLAAGDVIYSVNTGYGEESSRAIPGDGLRRVQQNTIASHAVGLGRPVAASVTRGMILLVAQAAAQGPPAVSPAVLDAYIRALGDRRQPVVPSLGSHSASDLVPGAHLAGDVLGGVELGPKDGGTVNNSAFTTALAVDALRAAERRVERAEAVAALTLEAVRGFPGALSERLWCAVRPRAPGARPRRSAATSPAVSASPGRDGPTTRSRCGVSPRSTVPCAMRSVGSARRSRSRSGR